VARAAGPPARAHERDRLGLPWPSQQADAHQQHQPRPAGRPQRPTVRRQLALIAEHGLIVTGQTRGGVRWVALTKAAVMPSHWRPPEPLRLHLAARACRSPAALTKLARAEAYLRDALLAEATMAGRAPPPTVADTRGRLLA
jgi:hypothetical protein